MLDTLKRDMEIKTLPGYTNDDLLLIQKFHGEMYTHYISNLRSIHESP